MTGGWWVTAADSSPQPHQCAKTGLTTKANIMALEQENIFDPWKLSITWKRLLLHHNPHLLKKERKKIITTTYSAPWDPGSIIINQKRFNYRETHWNAIVSELQNGSRRQFLGFIVGNKQSLISTWGDQDRRKEIFVYAQLLPADVWSHFHSEEKRFDFKGCVFTQDNVFVEYPNKQFIDNPLFLSNIWG